MKGILSLFTNKEDGNLAYHVNDLKENVDSNRKKLAKNNNYKYEDLVYMQQVHGNNVEIVNSKSSKLIHNCDGLITNEKNLPLMVMVADCIPILLFDDKNNVISALHAGRNSTFLKIVEIAIKKMIANFDTKPKNIKAILGPSIQKCCYEVSNELLEIVKNSFGEEFIHGKNIDLQGINSSPKLFLLEKNGVSNIEISKICTKCSNDEYYSYRKNKKTGRFAGIIKL